jgi:hypothetical protein
MSDDPPPGTEELAAYIEARYGDRFDEERRAALRERSAGYREAGETVSAFVLDNGDEPAFEFRAYREE